jgi:riboflavin kinase/FMN adenylyltransferase
MKMKVLEGLEAIRKRHRGAVITIGNFDGVHLGHQKIIREVIKTADMANTKSLAITFEPHPMKLLVPEKSPRILTPPEKKTLLLGRYGIDYVLIINFTREFSKLPPDEFIEDVLVKKLRARAVIVGHNYAFGKGKQGTTELLRRRGKKFGFEVKVVRNARLGGDSVSSSRIRSLLGWGRVCEVSKFLGRPYSIEGTVIKGAGRGSSILDTPTANIATPNEVVPKAGVYAVRTTIGKKHLDGVANIGKNPTFHGKKMSYEVHMLDFKENVVGKELRVFFIERIREERTFDSALALKEQIGKDIANAREILSKRPEAQYSL